MSLFNRLDSIDLEEAIGKYRRFVHSSHILLWTKDNSGGQEITYGLMLMRSDGRVGFPGGKSNKTEVDRNEIVMALHRKLADKINFTPLEGQITLENRVFSHLDSPKEKVWHFFAKELPLNEFQNLEKTHMNAPDFLRKSFGLFRIPLKTSGQSVCQPFRKFIKKFWEQAFAGNARNQLIESVIKLDLIGQNDVQFLLPFQNMYFL